MPENDYLHVFLIMFLVFLVFKIAYFIYKIVFDSTEDFLKQYTDIKQTDRIDIDFLKKLVGISHVSKENLFSISVHQKIKNLKYPFSKQDIELIKKVCAILKKSHVVPESLK